MNTAIEVKDVSKKYSSDLKRSMRYAIQDITKNLLGLSSKPYLLRKDEFWAIKSVSFKINKGETIGLIGSNGSGKTTLLKLINGIFWPDEGKLTINGRTGALIALGAGFHPLLTGRENIFVNAAILGMGKKETEKKFEQIVDFAEIRDFLDTPVKNYSSGMFAKLGFAVAIHCEPEILLIDEVLSVGDIRFQNKAFKKILELKNKSTVVFVSHNLAAVNSLCDRVIWLENGKIKAEGKPEKIIAKFSKESYLKNSLEARKIVQNENQTISGDLIVKKIELIDKNGKRKTDFKSGEPITIICEFEAFSELGKPKFQFEIISSKGGVVFGASMLDDDYKLTKNIIKGKGKIKCEFNKIYLNPGFYSIDVNIRPETGMGKLFRQLSAAYFTIKEIQNKKKNKRFSKKGSVTVPYSWEEHF